MAPSRSDGDPISGLHPVRRIMPFLMPQRNGAAVFFEQTVSVDPVQAFLSKINARRPEDRPATLFHVVLAALGRAIAAAPRLNRFIVGSRLYQRRGIWLAFSAKTALDRDAPLFTKKMEFDPEEPFEAMVDRVYEGVTRGRAGEDTATDKEIRAFLRLPAPILRLAIRAFRWLDAYNLVPRSFIENDPLYASAFVANLGSVGLDAAFHHLYEYGSIPIFVTIGRVHAAPVVRADGSVGSAEVFQLRYSYDERVEDGFYAARALEHLASLLAEPARLSRDG